MIQDRAILIGMLIGT